MTNNLKRINSMEKEHRNKPSLKPDEDHYHYNLPTQIPIFETKDAENYHWIITAIFRLLYKPGMSRQQFIDEITVFCEDAIERNDELLIEKCPKADEVEYLVDWFAIYIRYVMQKPKHFKVFSD